LERRQDQLVQSKKLSSIGTLTAGVAHQLNNPLNNISTSCQIAISELALVDNEFLMRMLKNIDQETRPAVRWYECTPLPTTPILGARQ